MSLRYRLIIVLTLVLGLPAIAVACLWDYDTLKQERYRFPSTLELVTGKFLRHSKEFYEWRIQDRLYKLAADPSNLGYHDDLAVAYEKTGQHEKAIETMLAKEKIKPGLYETYSNLGTFHILAGDLEAGLPYIDKALAINPDAHFGRERYQKWLVEYALEKRKDGKLIFPLRPNLHEMPSGQGFTDFQLFLKQRLGKEQLTEADLQQAVTGVLGMMRFANHANPLLLEALGDLLGSQHRPTIDAKRLATRAYLKAAYEVKDRAAQQGYRKLAEQALWMQTPDSKTRGQLHLTDLASEFDAELADAEKWYAELREREISWIRDGNDADAEFDRLYREEPKALGDTSDELVVGDEIHFGLGNKVVIAAGVVTVLLAGVLMLRWITRLIITAG